MKLNLFTQFRIGMWWGAVKQAAGQISAYVTFINMAMLSVTVYSTGWIQEHIVNLNYLQFVGGLAVVVLLLLLFAYKVDMPSYYACWNDQMWRHDNPMRREIEKQGRDIALIKKHLGIKNDN